MSMDTCVHEKVFENLLLTSDPPMQKWICRKCGAEGIEPQAAANYLPKAWIRFTIPGVPCGKGRARTVRLKNGASHSYTPEKTTNYENLVKLCFLEVAGSDFIPMDGQFMLVAHAYMPIPKSRPKKWQALALAGKFRPTCKPDWDNVGKIVADSLNGVAFHDDAGVVDGIVRKYYGLQPKVVVDLWRIAGSSVD